MTVPDLQILLTLALIGVAILAFATERLQIEVTCVAIVVAVLVCFHAFPVLGSDGSNLLGPTRVLAGFASPALASIMALIIVGHAIFQTNALDPVMAPLLRLGARWPALSLGAGLITAALVSAFMNNTPVVVMFIPIMITVGAKLSVAPSRALMPLSAITILGGMTTLVGSSTNLLVAGVAFDAGLPSVGFFDPVMPGLVLALVGATYAAFIMPLILGRRETLSEEVRGRGGHQFIAQIEVTAEHALIGTTSRAGLFPELKGMTIRLIQRGERTILPPFENVAIEPGDTIVVAATRNELVEALADLQPLLTTGDSGGGINEQTADLVMAETVVAPNSGLIGRSIEQAHLHAETGTIILGIQRRSRMVRGAFSSISLEAGDVILVLGKHSDVRGLRTNRNLILLEWSQSDVPRQRYAARALFVLAAVLIAVATRTLPIEIAAMMGALAMLVCGCISIRQAARAFDRRIYLLIGASLALAAPLEITGAALLIAQEIVRIAAGGGPIVILGALFALVAVFTNVLSNHATAAIFTPVAIATGREAGIDPIIVVHLVIYAANCSFATPMGNQTNLLVMGPGHYHFMDFVRAGTPLVILLWLVYCLSASWYYGL